MLDQPLAYVNVSYEKFTGVTGRPDLEITVSFLTEPEACRGP